MLIVNLIHIMFPLLALVLVIIGIMLNRKHYVTIALWLSLIALILHYRTSGGEILGVYFDYTHTMVYSLNMLVLVLSVTYLIFTYARQSNMQLIRYASGLLVAAVICSSVILMINLWVNAYFISNRMQGTPLLQVASPGKLDYCNYKYIFYKVDRNGHIEYLCPNYYGFIPSIGVLKQVPDTIVNQLPNQLQGRFSNAQEQ